MMKSRECHPRGVQNEIRLIYESGHTLPTPRMRAALCTMMIMMIRRNFMLAILQFSSVPYVDGKTFALPPLCLSPH